MYILLGMYTKYSLFFSSWP